MHTTKLWRDFYLISLVYSLFLHKFTHIFQSFDTFFPSFLECTTAFVMRCNFQSFLFASNEPKKKRYKTGKKKLSAKFNVCACMYIETKRDAREKSMSHDVCSARFSAHVCVFRALSQKWASDRVNSFWTVRIVNKYQISKVK